DEDDDNIVPLPDGSWRVHGLTEIEQFNEAFGTQFPDDDVDTVGGLLTNDVGLVPHLGVIITLPPLRFDVLRADAGLLHLHLVRRARGR
ncbi:hypothetical protein NYZ34_20165, partial [Acinetobacter baumannii]|nr:hypothetical protein [Acinetobacter baumannii]